MRKGEKAIDARDFDTSVSPKDDFFCYANGAWLEKTEIPPHESRWGSFDVLQEENEKKLHAILEEVANDKKVEDGTDRQKLRDYWLSGMDEKKIEEQGLQLIQNELSKIEAIASLDDLATGLAHLHSLGTDAAFGMFVAQDEKDSEVMALQFCQGGLGLPDRHYYFKDDEETKTIRKKYHAHLEKMFVLGGGSAEDAKENTRINFGIEKQFAGASKEREALRDPEENYHKMSVEELNALAPKFPWKTYFEEVGIRELTHVIIGQPEFLREFGKMVEEVPLKEWKVYFRFHFLSSVAGKLPKKFVDEQFDFYGRVFSGAKELRPRWKRVVSEIDGALGEVLGKVFVEKYFSAESKRRVKEMVEFIRETYAERIKGLDWMSEETKKEALKKLSLIRPKIGYPDKWRNYSGLVIDQSSYVENHLRACRFEFAHEIGKLGKPVNRNEWEMTPPTVNAYFHPTMQEIAFPAGILQPPFFYPDADDAVNYGAIGSVIGHELTHGFDDQGRKYDEKGNMHDWWSENDAKHFQKHADALAKQYDEYEPIKGFHINGKLTLGENIADLGGLVIAYHAFLKSLEGKKEPNEIDDMTARERFFLAMAISWRAKVRNELLKTALVVDPHAPSVFRVNGPASNMKEFYSAFNVKEGDKLFRQEADRVKIW